MFLCGTDVLPKQLDPCCYNIVWEQVWGPSLLKDTQLYLAVPPPQAFCFLPSTWQCSFPGTCQTVIFAQTLLCLGINNIEVILRVRGLKFTQHGDKTSRNGVPRTKLNNCQEGFTLFPRPEQMTKPGFLGGLF